ncbi:MAG TPA: TonB-dependent receptor, partial [Bryobacteraceae bacterium]|nr:TonB-dependent receptor [Bryobacteraceae bacterium]
DNNSRESGGQLGYEAQSVTPSVDAVEEFRVVTNNLSAEYGGRMGGTVIVNLRSGTNSFHGSAFEFLRNSTLDGTNFFANLNGAGKPPFKRNQFGGTAGGRIIRDKLFYFGSFEGTRTRNGQSFTSTVPTMLQRQGNFSQQLPIFDPATTQGSGGSMTRQPFAGNIIPQSRWDPLFPKLLALYPAPTTSGLVNNYFYSPVEKDRTDSYDGKLDYNWNDTTRFTGRYSFRNTSNLLPGPLPLPADGGAWQTVDLQSHNAVASVVKTFSPTLTDEFRFGLTRTRSLLDIPYAESLFGEYGIQGIPKTSDPSSNDHGLTLFAPTGYASLGPMAYWPNTNNLDYFQFSNILYKTAGSHTLKFGADIHREHQLRRAARFSRGQYSFTREFTADPQHRATTGDGLAEFMLGTAGGGTLGNENGEYLAFNYFDGFVQDDWHLTRRLTLNLGLRYDLFMGTTFPDGGVSTFVMDFANTGPNARLQQVKPKDGSDCGCDQNWKNFAPRVGLAFQATPKTVLRAGYGIIYGQPDSLRGAGSHFSNQAPDYVEYNLATQDRIHPLLTLSQGFPAIQLPAPDVPGPALVGISAATPYLPTQYSGQYFFDVQRELPWGLATTIGYAGNETHHLTAGINWNLPVDGPSPIPVAQRRRWPYYTGVNTNSAFGNLSYNALTWRVEKRFSQGLQFISAFTWSHTIDNVLENNNNTPNEGSVVPYNRSLDRANSVTDVPLIYVLSGYYELPTGKGKRWFHSGLGAALFGGWQVGGAFT